MISCRVTATRLLPLCSRYAPSTQLGAVQGWQHYVRSTMTSPRDMKLLDNRVIVLTMPMLSPTMTEASLSGWAKQQGQVIDPYDLVYELETETLTEEAYRMGDFAGT